MSKPTLAAIRRGLRDQADPERAPQLAKFCQAHCGGYGEGDRFLGVTVPRLRVLARAHRDADEQTIRGLITSPYHEERLLGLLMLVDRHRRAPDPEKRRIARTYLALRAHVNNWDLVDTSAPDMLGPHLDEFGAVLARLAASPSVWDRRIAVLATFPDMRAGEFRRSLQLATRLLHDPHDLIHKAVGWMLREIGDRDPQVLRRFLDKNAPTMPRTMLRYAIEKFPKAERARYLAARS